MYSYGDWWFDNGRCSMAKKKKDNYNHFNVAKLDVVLKGINLALKWGLREVVVRTDSATVLSKVNSTVEESGRIHMKSAEEMIA